MRAVIQRCSRCSVTSEGQMTGNIGTGLTVLLGIHREDSRADADYIVKKVLGLRIFEDESHKLNLSVSDIHGELMVVSQFTLYDDCRHGRRPSFTEAAPPEKAKELYEYAVSEFRKSGLRTETGRFQTEMTVSLDNWGPVTILIDSSRLPREVHT